MRGVMLEAGELSNVNPYHLAARIRQEIGATKSPSVTGTVSRISGYI